MHFTQRIKLVTAAMIGAAMVYLLPTPALATVTVVSSGGAEDITATANLMSPDENTEVFAFVGEEDAAYDLVFSSDAEPMVITLGADMENAHDWTYDATAGTITMHVTYTGIVSDDGDPSNNDNMFIIALVFSDGAVGSIPTDMLGSAMSTNLLQWMIVPPMPDAPYFGFQLTGTPGTTGFFHMFIPEAAIDHISDLSGEQLTPESMAVFVDDQQASLSITEVDGGAYIDINITFVEDAIGISASSITKTVTAGAKEPVSLVAKRTSLAKGATAKLYGWIDQTKAGKEVVVYRKLKGETTFTIWKTVETNSQGYYKINYTARKTAKFKAKYKGTTTDKVTVTVD